MEFFDYDMDNEECDKLLEEAEPCEECGETETLAIAVITAGEHFGSLLIFCAECSLGDEDNINIEKKEKLIYA